MFWNKKDEEERKRKLEEQRKREEDERKAKKIAKNRALKKDEARKKQLAARKKLNEEEAQAYLEMLGLAEPSSEGGEDDEGDSKSAPRKEEIPALSRGLGSATTAFGPNGFQGFSQGQKPKDPANPVASKAEREKESASSGGSSAKAEAAAAASFPRLQRPF